MSESAELVAPMQMQVDSLIRICVKALHYAKAEARPMLIEVLGTVSDHAWALPTGFTSLAFDQLAHDARERDPSLAADLAALADYRRPIDGQIALTKRAVADDMVIPYDVAKRLGAHGGGWRTLKLGGKWRLLPMPDNAGFAVVPL